MANGNGLTEAEQRKYWRLRWLSALQAFTDTSTQNSKWVDAQEANPHFSFVECMCCYFDDADLADEGAYDRRIARGYLTLEEANTVAEFHCLADRYTSPGGNDYDERAILRDEAWHEVVQAAERAQAKLVALLTDPHEVSALMKPSVWDCHNGIFEGRFPDPN